jgi:CDP-glycerol glycerophosphotransferase
MMAPPRLTVALVVYREQAYLREAVCSVLEQGFPDLELLAIDNATPDHGRELLDELAESDDRLTLVRLDRTIALGAARNLALDRAGGDYVWFVETTDLLPRGALAAVAARLDESLPDVLVVDDTRAGSLGPPRPGPHGALIRAAASEGAFTLDRRPETAELAADVWNKVFAREFLGAIGARFGAGGHDELTVTYPALFVADRISVLDRPCYARRRPANAARERSVHGTPFDVFEQYDAVFRFLDARGGAVAARRGLLQATMLRHCLVVLGGVGEDRRKEFFRRTSETYRRQTRAGGLDATQFGLQEHLAMRGHYGSFRALQSVAVLRPAVNARFAAVARTRAPVAKGLRRGTLKAYYRLQRARPIEPELAVFAAYWYRGYSCNPRAIYESLLKLVPSVRGVWIVNRAHAGTMPDGVDHVVAGTREYYRLVARAKYFVNNVGFPDEVVKRKGTIRVHTHHGTPLKTMGLDLRSAFFAGPRMDFERQFRRWARWDYSVSQNAFSTLVWERVYPARYETLEVGYPRNDVLVNASDADVQRIRGELGIERHRCAVLYAPTHREYLHRDVPPLDVGRLADDLGRDYVVLVRAHYLHSDAPEVEAVRRRRGIVDVSRHPSVEELCLAADVLVTDYSSIMFDYAVLDRPVVIHAPDWDVYRTLRGTYFDLLDEAPGVVARTDDELVSAFRSGAVWAEEATRLRAAFRARFCSLEDGAASERVVRRVWFGEDSSHPAHARDDLRTKVQA